MGLFSKKYKPLSEYGDLWKLAEGANNGKPMVVRFNASLQQAAGHVEYPYQIGVAVPLNHPESNGLPEKSESSELENIEDRLIELFSDKAELVMVITTNGMREFVLYAKEWIPEQYDKEVAGLAKSLGTHELQFMMKKDPAWDTFKSILKF